MPEFVLRGTVTENVLALREALGSATRMLSRDDLAEMIGEKHPGRAPNGTSVQRWEQGTEPDIMSIRIMADLAGVSFEQFALGDPARRAAAEGEGKRGAQLSQGGIPVPRPGAAAAEKKKRA